ncbi:MAG: HEPN domain-containing protein [Candidatus Nanohaloarchaea archaeon]
MNRLEKAEEKLAAAEYLLEGGYYEDSISRTYYGMYHAAKALLESENIMAKTHSGLIRMIGKEFVKTGKLQESLGKAFSIAEESREVADYDIEIGFDREETKKRLEEAREFLEKVRQLLD